ncbi:MAG: 50S ribosomal protein L20 [Bacteroidota bacterium]
MPRSVNSVASRRRRKKILKAAKGYFGARKNVWTVAKNAVDRAMAFAYIGRKLKKRAYRSLWIARINAGARQNGMSYSRFMHALNQHGIDLNRKVLADMAMNHPKVFADIVNRVNNT